MPEEVNIWTFLQGVVGEIVGGVLAATIAFLLWKRLFPMPNLSGEWEFSTNTENSTYNPYSNLWPTYRAHILHDGTSLRGTGEKFSERAEGKDPYEFESDKRVHISIDGSIQRRGFRSFDVNVHQHEVGRIRETSWSHELKVTNNDTLEGRFRSTSADQRGRVKWRRLP